MDLEIIAASPKIKAKSILEESDWLTTQTKLAYPYMTGEEVEEVVNKSLRDKYKHLDF